MMGLGSWQLIRIASYARQSFRCQLVVARARLLSLQKVNYSLAMMRLAFGRISMRAFSTMHSRRGIGSDQRGPSMYGDESYFDKHSAMKLSSREKRRVLIEEYRRKANLFTHLVIEKFTEKEMKEAKSVLDFLSEVRANDPSALKLQLLLWGRLAEEVLKCQDRLQLEPIYIKNILNLWRDSSLESSNMLHPIELVKKLQAVSKSLPNFGFDSEAACIIMDVAIKKASRTKVEIIVTLLFRLICEAGVHPDAQLFERLMQAASIRHNLSSMEHLIHRQKNLYELDPTLNSLQYLLHGYCKKSEMEQAENVLDQMLNCPDTPNLDRKYVISDGYQAVLSSYHAIVEKSDGMKREEVARSAKLFFDKMKEHATTCRKSLFTTCQAMIDIYSCTNEPEKIATLVDDLHLDSAKLSSLVNNFASRELVDKANVLVQSVIQHSEFVPDISVFESLIHAYSQTKTISNSFENAYHVFKLVDENPKFKLHGIRPATSTFNVLLQCLEKQTENSSVEDVGKGANQTLDEMERRFRLGEEAAKPSVESFDLAIRICLNVGDYGRADALLERIKEWDFSLSKQQYNQFLRSLSQKRNELAARQADKIIAMMLSSGDPLNMPDAESFALAMEAWSDSGSSDTASRMFAIYERMQPNGMDPSADANTTMIKFLCKTNQFDLMEKAESILQRMEFSPRIDMQPSQTHYSQIAYAWIGLNEPDKAADALTRSIAQYVDKKDHTAPSLDLLDKVVNCLLANDEVLKATSLLEKFQALKDTDQIPEDPMFRTYNALRLAWKHSHIPDKEFQIINIMKVMGRLRRANPAAYKRR